jgi:hypothetical protein
MALNAPKQITWFVALILGILGLLGTLVTLPIITATVGFWLVVLALVLMLLATVVTGL